MAATKPAIAATKSGIELLTGSAQAADKLPTLPQVFAETAQALSQSLKSSPKSTLEMKVTSANTGRAGDVLTAHAESVVSAAMRCDQWEAMSLVGLDRGFLNALIDMLFGGDGAEPPFRAERALTKAEIEISRWLFGLVEQALRTGFGRVAPASFTVEQVDCPPAFECIGRPSATVAAASFELSCIGGTGGMFVALPQSALAFLRNAAPREEVTKTGGADPAWSKSLSHQLGRAGVSMNAVLGTTKLTLGDIAGLRPGQILELDSLAGSPVRLDCKGQPLYWCKLGQRDGNYTLTVDHSVDHEQEFMDDILSH